METTVSVIIPAFNAALTIERAIRSVLDQTGLLEIIIVDDCSTDNTVYVVIGLKAQYPVIKLMMQEKNEGVSAARNAGIAGALGEYIAFLDADDIWLPGKLNKQLSEIINRDEVALVTCDSLQLSPDGEVLKRAHVNRPPFSGDEAWKTLLAYNFIPTPTVLVRKKDIDNAGGFSEELPVAEDLDLWIRISLMGKVVVLPEVFVHYYDYPGSLMKSGSDKIETIILTMIEQHIRQSSRNLNTKEIKHIYSVRNFDFGLQHFFCQDFVGSITYFMNSINNNYRVFKSVQYIVRGLILTFLKIVKV